MRFRTLFIRIPYQASGFWEEPLAIARRRVRPRSAAWVKTCRDARYGLITNYRSRCNT
jgi:hypothetical protein